MNNFIQLQTIEEQQHRCEKIVEELVKKHEQEKDDLRAIVEADRIPVSVFRHRDATAAEAEGADASRYSLYFFISLHHFGVGFKLLCELCIQV